VAELRCDGALAVRQSWATGAKRLNHSRYAWLDTAIGKLLLTADADEMTTVIFPDKTGEVDLSTRVECGEGVLEHCATQLREYFDGSRQQFDLPLAPAGTEFQRSVWQALLEIPYGETVTYAWVAKHVGRPTAYRAVGAANGQNPIPIIIPCHRVVGSDGSLTGFGGGLMLKRALLQIEQPFTGVR